MHETSQCAPVQEYHRSAFSISTDRTRLDLDVIHSFLTESYWAREIPREVVARSVENSLCFGVYRGEEQVGFARVISDFATYAYIADVFILEPYRGHGLGKWLIGCIVDYPDLRNLRRWSLVTRDAHELYSQFGFHRLKAPERWMELYDPEVYTKQN
ncbi:MAG TPA: GNAT family N-acetyltransferase [Terriglobales bacterium]|nr:GNAT family N-acetyltransferase [Terriglobales bacterium]